MTCNYAVLSGYPCYTNAKKSRENMAFLSSYQHLITPDLILRPITLTDAPAIFSYASDPRVAHFTHWHPHSNLDETIRYITQIQQMPTTQVWGIEEQDSKMIIGECSITLHENGRAELYYALGYNYWGKGYATQALTTLLTIAEATPAIERLEAWIIKENISSCRVAQKAGLQLIQTIEQAWVIRETTHDIAVYCK